MEEQIAFVRADLADNPRLLALKSAWDEPRMIVQGTRLTYRLRKFYPRAANSESTWDYAFCDTCEQNEPARTNILGTLELEANSLSILRIGEARRNYSRSRGKLRSWEELKRKFDVVGAPIPRERRFHQALALTQFIDTLFAAADSFPVEVVDHAVGDSDDVARLTVRVREDSEREQLSNALRLRAPAARFREVLMEERADGNWVLTESRQVGMQEPTDSEWSFESEGSDSEGYIYEFSGSVPPPPLRDPLMIPGDFVGRDVQFQRRLSALRALADHAELLWMLVDPRQRILDSHESVGEFDFVDELDSSKREAFADIVKTVPLYLLQGPPGVGKTRMVRSLVKWVFEHENAARILLTAQSNAAVDHLLETLDETFQDESANLLTVRCRAPDRQDAPSSYDVLGRANELLGDFSTSDLVADASAGLQERVGWMAADVGDGHSSGRVGDRDGTAGRERQALEGLVVRAANVVLATSNSRELERLVDERGQFDWTVVEEAGKAVGVELLAPLLLSYRRLLIGDHRQLAPFGAERLMSLLEDPASVKQAIQWGREFVSRTLRDASTDEVLDEIDRDDEEGGSEADFGELCSLALNAVLLFERLVEDEFKFQKLRPGVRKLARRLDQQHRMHPAIARLVSRCFYDNGLLSAAETIGRFEPAMCPVVSRDTSRLPEVPIVVVDMPYVQTTQDMKGGDAEQQPRWCNPLEVDAVLKVLKLLETKSDHEGRTSLAVLSPYRRQVSALQSRLDEDRKDLTGLNQFRPAVVSGRFCGTVDSFQGNEADVVVVSLVRNNHHSSVRAAFGFLSDRRRMNVLLSRAKWRLILVFSMEFFETVLASSSATAAGEEVMFMREMLSSLEDACAEGEAAVVPWERLRAGGDL
ncbi:MAG: AAA domain-containing protein [Bryobacterales bacterium]|nr:AAA domain-containing protein [Bryobacterales bacterium]